jgi:gliding motility-associated-like protein
VDPSFSIDLGPDQILCTGTQTTLSSGITDGSPHNWNTGEITPDIVVNTNNTYTVTVTRASCTASDEVTVSFDLLPPAIISVGPDTTICDGDAILLDAGNEPGATYLWQDGSTTSTFSVTQDGIYHVTVTNDCGSITDTIEIVLEECIPCGVYVPSAFTPNADGNNDLFAPIPTCEVTQYRFSVFNRWNEMVFTTDQVTEGWDGIYNGQPQTLDVYVYFVSYFDPRLNKNILQKGYVNLLR